MGTGLKLRVISCGPTARVTSWGPVFLRHPSMSPLRLAILRNNEEGLFGSKEERPLTVVGTISKKQEAMTVCDNGVEV